MDSCDPGFGCSVCNEDHPLQPRADLACVDKHLTVPIALDNVS